MLPTNALSIRNEDVWEAIRKLAPRDGAKFNGIRISSDFISKSFGFRTVKQHNLLGILGLKP
uniref:Uncharacterized protein n=1 Tax=Lotus japonicus TaxID=34305 RepID=I3SCV7_LOTJA|nr:unknown [Lotus japonicus]